MTVVVDQVEAGADDFAAREADGPASREPSVHPGARHLIDFILVIFVAAVVFRGFVLEGYYVPTGSMAPNLLGFHRHATCPECGYTFDVGMDSHGWSDEATCPVCLSTVPIDTQVVESGDRLLVLKWFFDVQSPKRWRTIVFRNPNDAGQAYVKRVVGLPGESIRILAGDVYVDGQIARKTFEELSNMRLNVYDHDSGSKATSQPKRFVTLSGGERWSQDGARLKINTADAAQPTRIAYRHLDDRGREVPVDDFNGYNADPSSPHERVSDLILRLTADHKGGEGWLGIRYEPSSASAFELRVFPSIGRVEFRRDDKLVANSTIAPWPDESRTLTLAYWDLRLGFRIDGQNPFDDDFDFETVNDTPALASTRPYQISAQGADWAIEHFRIDRDVHYGSRPRGGFAVSSPVGDGQRLADLRDSEEFLDDEEYRLDGGEYFMLGDNSSISNDSRSWNEKAVPEGLLIGKPMFIHLPTRVWQTTLFGRRYQLSIPDVFRMRMVR